jgi:asparagine synthase (glutamine-hydrolysing)
MSQSDTEVLLHAYAEWGVDCLARLNGIFAFVVWDTRRRRLFGARDRLGVKPLFYTEGEGTLLFSSEIKGILAAERRQPVADEGVIYGYLRRQRLGDTDHSFFAGVNRLPAGSYFEVENGRASVASYWTISDGPEVNVSFRRSTEMFRSLFRDSLKLQMRSDVPVGCCLSGGLDSASVVSVASAMSPKPMQCFTARFRDGSMDEWRYARLLRGRMVKSHSVFVEPAEFWQALPAVVTAQEQPFGGPGVFAQWRLFKLIKEKGIKVVLDGQGGDELLCGYAKYYYYSILDLLRDRRPIAALSAIIDGFTHGPQHRDFRAGVKYLPGFLHRAASQVGWLAPDFAASHSEQMLSHPTSRVRGQQLMDIKQYSLPVLLRFEDKSSMAHSVEARVPFLDHRLVEFLVRLPTEYKVRGTESKLVLRRALAADVPEQILRRRTKLGFGGSYASWVKALEPVLLSWLSQGSRPADRFLRLNALPEMIRQRDPAIFRIVILDAWMRAFGVS